MTGDWLPNQLIAELIELPASVLSVCVPTELIFAALRILAVLLGLAIRFSKSELRLPLLFCGDFVFLLYIYIRRHSTSFCCAASAFLLCSRALWGGEGGGFYIRFLKVVKVLFSSIFRRDPASQADLPTLEVPAFPRFRGPVKDADQVINHLFSCPSASDGPHPTVLRSDSDFVS